MGWTAVRIPFCVVDFRICFALLRPMFMVRAKCSGVMRECLELVMALLALAGFVLPPPLLLLGYETRTDDTSRSKNVSATKEDEIEPKTRSLSYSTGANIHF